jgi:predicted ribosome quality control (RQC) complex YloA/Tae2 family protein
MMHFHYYALLHIAEAIRSTATGALLIEAYTQEKDQVVIALASPDQELYLRVACGSPLSYIWPMRHGSKARKNVLALFEPAYNQPLRSVEVVAHDRVLLLHFGGGYTLVLKMHNILSNVILLRKGEVVERFRQNLEADLSYTPTPGAYDPHWEETAAHGEGLPIADRLRMVSPVLDKNFARRVSHHIDTGLDFTAALKAVIAEAESGRFYLVQDPTRLQFLLFPPETGAASVYTDIREALDVFLRTWYQYDAYARQYTQHSKALAKQLGRLQGQLKSNRLTVQKINSERAPEEIGHILMANLHHISLGMMYVDVVDFYNDRTIRVKLRPDLNPQQNAEEHYNKQKKHRSRVRHLELQITALEEELLSWMAAEEAFAKLVEPAQLTRTEYGLDGAPARALAAFTKQYGHMLAEGKSSSGEEARKHPFFEFNFLGYTILAGKNAKQNDQLSFQYSKKTDIWLHARDAFGSHVIVRNPQDRDLPNAVLEYAASIAARLSKRKHEGLVPVQYTPRKFVRKMKNGAAGQVTIEREKVVMVAPIAESAIVRE